MFESMVYTRKNDEAVSPVIGVILMVAITVILAAVIAAFVFGMSGNISKTKTVAITVQKIDSNNIAIMNNGGQDAGQLNVLKVTSDPNTGVTCSPVTANMTATYPCTLTMAPIPVGTTIKLTGASGATVFSGRTQVIAVGTFNDGSNQVLLDTFV